MLYDVITATVLAALALDAGVGIKEILPGKVAKLPCAKALDLLVFQVERRKLAHWSAICKKCVGGGGEDVPELGEGDDGDEGHGQQQMEPPFV